MDILEAVKNGQFEWNFYWKLDYHLWRLHLSRGRRLYLPFKLIYKLFQFLFIGLGLFFSNLFSCFLGVALRHGIVRLQITKLINKTNCRVWISSFNVNIIKYFRIYQVTSEEESVAEALVPATVSVSVTCHVTNHVKVNSFEIFSNPHLVRGLFISLRHCDDLHRIWSLDLLTATVMRFVALNELYECIF